MPPFPTPPEAVSVVMGCVPDARVVLLPAVPDVVPPAPIVAARVLPTVNPVKVFLKAPAPEPPLLPELKPPPPPTPSTKHFVARMVTVCVEATICGVVLNIVLYVWSPNSAVVELAVPEPRRTVATVPAVRKLASASVSARGVMKTSAAPDRLIGELLLVLLVIDRPVNCGPVLEYVAVPTWLFDPSLNARSTTSPFEMPASAGVR